ncbi:Protein CBG13997 [Caenorhabditis briggsae]|uniref:Protein CBG13997 n=1 Tax=Caenorhabditis briggsae TaxID=6238 RepID=A8XJ64_CAEBR|nr:Protein CBG13997 [Caenorhabditis briggsae]CAP32689.1 Protein CBG13997 [Caenorhabditis briggsae]
MLASRPLRTCVQKENSSERKFVQFPSTLSCQLEKLFCADVLMLQGKEKTSVSISPAACALKLEKVIMIYVFFLKTFFVFFHLGHNIYIIFTQIVPTRCFKKYEVKSIIIFKIKPILLLLVMTVSLAVANEDYSIEALKNETSTEKVIILYNGTFTCANTPFCAMATYHRATRDNLKIPLEFLPLRKVFCQNNRFFKLPIASRSQKKLLKIEQLLL